MGRIWPPLNDSRLSIVTDSRETRATCTYVTPELGAFTFVHLWILNPRPSVCHPICIADSAICIKSRFDLALVFCRRTHSIRVVTPLPPLPSGRRNTGHCKMWLWLKNKVVKWVYRGNCVMTCIWQYKHRLSTRCILGVCYLILTKHVCATDPFVVLSMQRCQSHICCSNGTVHSTAYRHMSDNSNSDEHRFHQTYAETAVLSGWILYIWTTHILSRPI